MVRLSLKFAIFLFACAALLARVAMADVVVSPVDMYGWSTSAYDGNFATVPGVGSTSESSAYNSANLGVSFVTGPPTPPAGVGSANLYTLNGTGDGNAVLGTNGISGGLAGVQLSALTSLSYWTYDTANNG